MDCSSDERGVSAPEKSRADRWQLVAAVCGLLAVSVFSTTFVVVACLTSGFDLTQDFISQLGAFGQPYAVCWNLLGFALVGLLLAFFGWFYGLCRQDRWLGAGLVIGGCGFALAAIPTDLSDVKSLSATAHFVSVCLSLAGYCLAMARLTGPTAPADDRRLAQWAVGLSLLPIICVPTEISAEPVAHRFLLIVVFTWVVLTCLGLLKARPNSVLS